MSAFHDWSKLGRVSDAFPDCGAGGGEEFCLKLAVDSWGGRGVCYLGEVGKVGVRKGLGVGQRSGAAEIKI